MQAAEPKMHDARANTQEHTESLIHIRCLRQVIYDMMRCEMETSAPASSDAPCGPSEDGGGEYSGVTAAKGSGHGHASDTVVESGTPNISQSILLIHHVTV